MSEYIQKASIFFFCITGKGVFSKKKFFKGEPLLEYKGILKECKFLEADEDTYIFEFKFKDKMMV